MLDQRSSSFRRVLIKCPTNCSRFQVLLLCMLLCSSNLYYLSTILQPTNSDSHNFSISASVLRHSSFENGMIATSFTLNWSYTVPNISSLNHSLYGNRNRLGYKLAFWNCRKGLINKNGCSSAKVVDIKRFVVKNKPHVFGIIETDLHSHKSRLDRRTVVTKSQIEDQLNIEGYSIELPCTWDSYGHAQSCICLCQ